MYVYYLYVYSFICLLLYLLGYLYTYLCIYVVFVVYICDHMYPINFISIQQHKPRLSFGPTCETERLA